MLDTITGPDDVKRLSPAQLRVLAADIRQTLVRSLARTGGHLGPNLGCVELTIALHRVFRSPHDRIVFDTGHQSYVHKLLTGRADRFATIRQRGGLSGYPSRAESCHDLVENSHASTALSYADGLAKAAQLRGEHDRYVVAVIGDGALTGGMVWEALNNISAADRPVIIVVNDNGRSYSPTAGGLAARLASLRLSPRYERTLAAVKAGVHRVRRVGPGFYELLRRTKRGMKDLIVPQSLFQDLGLKYVGPIDGHDIDAVERSLARARDFGESVIVHCVTEKGRGYRPAETHTEDCLHGTGPYDVETGKPVRASGETWTSVFGAELADIASERSDVVGITAAMLHPTGLGRFAERFPERVFDVGIAEQHATTSAAGLAMGGLHPVVALYATFLNRAFDQVLMDVALHGLPVTFALDRAGVTGDDGPSHNGMWDLSVLQVVPGLGIAAPRDGRRLRELLREAVDVDGPTVVRYPKGALGADIDAVGRVGGMDLLRGAATGDLLLVGVGPMAGVCRDVAARLEAIGIGCAVVDPRWVSPLDDALIELAAGHRAVAVVEDNGRVGGVGDGVSRLLRDHRVRTPVHILGIPQEFLDHAKRAELLTGAGLTGELLEHALREMVDCLEPRPA